MKSLVLLLAVLTACQADTTKLNEKIDKLDKKIDALLAQRGGAGAANQPRPQRPEPDRSKTYAVPVENDVIEGPADAKVTLIEAFDYA
jgi:hypothetical protein